MTNGENLAFARRVIAQAWADLPARHRSLLESIGAHRWDVTDRPLGTYADDLLRSAGYSGLTAAGRRLLVHISARAHR